MKMEIIICTLVEFGADNSKNTEITNLDKGGFLTQIDGEPRQINTNTIKITVKKKALSVVVPQNPNEPR